MLRSDPVATRVLVAQIGVLCGPEAPFEDVASFLGGGRPPQGMDQAEYTIRVKEIAGSLLPRPESLAELSAIVAEAVAELKTLRKVVQESADRDLAFDAVTAQMSSTPEGTRLANLVDKHEKGFMAALRRVHILQQPPKKPPGAGGEGTKSEIRDPRQARNPNEASTKPPGASAPMTAAPADVAAEVQVTVAAEVPIDEPVAAPLTTIEAELPKTGDAPGWSTVQAGSEIFRVEAIEAPPGETGAEIFRVEAIEAPPGETGAEIFRVEAIEAPPGETGAEIFRVEATTPEPVEADVKILRDEATDDEPGPADDFTRFGPEAECLRRLGRRLDAIYGAGGADQCSH